MRINPAALKSLREMSGLSQVDLAGRAGVSQRMISALEAGERQARPATIKKLAVALGVPIPAIAITQPEGVGS